MPSPLGDLANGTGAKKVVGNHYKLQIWSYHRGMKEKPSLAELRLNAMPSDRRERLDRPDDLRAIIIDRMEWLRVSRVQLAETSGVPKRTIENFLPARGRKPTTINSDHLGKILVALKLRIVWE